MKIFLSIILSAFMLSSIQLEAVPAIFVYHSKRNKKINAHFIKALNTGGRTWHEIEFSGYPDEKGMGFGFIPEGHDSEKWENRYDFTSQDFFGYREYNATDVGFKARDLFSFFDEVVSSKPCLPDEKIYFYTENVLFKNENEIRVECYLKLKQQTGKVTVVDGENTRTNIRTTNYPENEGVTALWKIVRINDQKYAKYTYEAKHRVLSQEEKDYWFQMFDYAKIDF